MPVLAPIGIADAEATPITHTFNPAGSVGSVASLKNGVSTTPAGNETLTLEYREPANSTAAHRLILKGNFPVEATVDGQVQVVRNSSFELTFNFSQKSTLQERKNYMKLVSNLLLNATVKGMGEGPEMAW